MRVETAAEALSILADNDIIWCQSMAATPYKLLEGLAEIAPSRKNMTLLQLHTEHSEMLGDAALSGHLRQRAFFVGKSTREAVSEGLADYVPIFLSEIPKLFRSGEQHLDAVLIQVSAPDAHGNCSLGISVEATRAALQVAKKVIAWVNPKMPRTHGDSFVHMSRIDRYFELAQDLPLHQRPQQSKTTLRIGERVAELINDGDCLQMGIGAIPDATLGCLTHHRDLGIHTEMFSDGVLPLVTSGVINNSRKRKHRGRIVTTFAMGSQELYDFVDDNPQVAFLDVEYTNDTAVIRQNKQVMAINSALQVDLTGQVCADSIGTKVYSGVGGQMDFVRGASLSEGGRSVIALPATAAGGQISRISAMLAPGAGVVTTRAHVHYVVTEYGVANLRARSLTERAEALIHIAAPQFREQLARDARDDWGLRVKI
ncbi:acetyl-CoA hydrolase/transferase family protein [Pseudidiomarina terrestris]|uniref:Acetyl-CoA hydrolase/transferase family protein n=1 Tax=Pseudidiomarina terrestris TaxID=2820060 RepID=A0ABT8MHS3_9GAMM|nr:MULTISPECIES: acetyl-CoA hydrolase/transferase C-terminal domain-containing protein [unclassified Pseudidiomarina]MDN7128206.1 acetyl-CoA hydrolase/transferase family protein [Pseudidiomarina sp. 1APR75-33.1]MDN7129486.1 acetyl-CoA hydrolase/transferase family protein [Pseudidiomarina sp. 1APR75-15]MDN7135802.1 acetyl-CoA hydrolase/transferase family protein [Pseudidiomarina sp. 1ASP75-5]MDN7138254.1 acetyl-CoA hydrolase/transferase family protein [Pseudidiomarina sp. 1ASP75-14]MEA3587962.1